MIARFFRALRCTPTTARFVTIITSTPSLVARHEAPCEGPLDQGPIPAVSSGHLSSASKSFWTRTALVTLSLYEQRTPSRLSPILGFLHHHRSLGPRPH